MEGEADPFEFFLAERLTRSVAELRDSITPREYLEWQAFYAWRKAQEEVS